MKYICLVYQDETMFQKMSKEEMDKLTAEYRSFYMDIHKSGQLVTSQGLSPTHTATTVRVRNGKTLTTDGPFVETKEQLGSIYIVEAHPISMPRSRLLQRYPARALEASRFDRSTNNSGALPKPALQILHPNNRSWDVESSQLHIDHISARVRKPLL